MFVHRKGKGDADTRVLLHVIFRYAVYRRARAEIVGPVHTSPHAAAEVVADMRLHGVDGILLKGVAAEKIVIIGEESHAGGEFQLEFPDRFGDSEARLEGPAVRPNVHCFAGVVPVTSRSTGCPASKADPDNWEKGTIRSILPDLPNTFRAR